MLSQAPDKIEKKFRNVIVAEPGQDFTALKQYAGKILFAGTGYEDVEDLPEIFRHVLEAQFNPETDAIVAAGRVNACFVLGMQATKAHPDQPINLGIYRQGDYTWSQI